MEINIRNNYKPYGKMISLIEHYCSELNIHINNIIDYEIEYTSNLDDFNVVDGEEGDHGIIKYYDTNNKLIGVLQVNGGDDEEAYFTDYGKLIYSNIVQNALIDKIKKYNNEYTLEDI